MAIIKKDGGFMSLPINIKRGNPIPLDTTSIWYDYQELVDYAQSSVTAYVGQIVTHVNEEANTATVYVIADAEGSLLKVGSGAGGGDAVNVDEHTIVLDDDGLLTLRDFGKRYYRYVPATNEADATYVLQEVDEEHPWLNGLTPQVVTENGSFVIGWYEPNPTTLEGVNTAIAGLQADIAGIKEDYLTKEEAKAEFAGATHYRGTVETKDDLDLKTESAVAGDIYIIKDTEKEYIFDGSNWEELGSQNDLTVIQAAIERIESAQKVTTADVASLTTDVQSINSNIDALQKADEVIAANVTNLSSELKELQATVGTPATETAEATGIYQVIQAKIDNLNYISGVTINGTDAPIVEAKVQLVDFNKSSDLSGLVPIPTAEVLSASEQYVLSATGDWVKPVDTRIGSLEYDNTTYETVTEYIDARVEETVLTWSVISE